MSMIRNCPIRKKENLNDKYCLLGIYSPEMVEQAEAGQFVNLEIPGGNDPLLKRPISIHKVDREEGLLYVLFKIIGKGTKILSQLDLGDEIQVLGPLGTGFTLVEGQDVLLIGGGIGSAPLHQLAEDLKKQGNRLTVLLGLTNEEDLVLAESLHTFDPKWILMNGNGQERQGLVTELIEELPTDQFSQIYTCGPHPMLEALQKMFSNRLADIQFSMEEKMGCGIGLCFSCTCKVKDEQRTDGWSNERICTRGPVFRGDEVIL